MICQLLIDTDQFQSTLEGKNSKVDLSVQIHNAKCKISHRDQINTQVALFEDIFNALVRTETHFLTRKSLHVLVLTLSQKV